MTVYEVQDESGETYEIDIPDGISVEEAMQSVGSLGGSGQNKMGPSGATWGPVQNFLSGVLQGMGDEVSAVGAAAKESLSGGLSFNKAYDQALTAYRGAREQFAQESPVTSAVTDIAGQVAPFVAAAPLMPAINAPTIAGRMAQSGVQGAGAGAVSGALNVEGDLEDRAAGAVTGAAIGAATGAAAVPVVEGIAAVGSKTVNAVRNALARTPAADKKIAEQIANIGGGDLQKGISVVKQRLTDAGPDAALVDVLDIPGQKMARAAANVPGGAQIADDFTVARAAGRGGRLQAAADRLAQNNFYDDIERLAQQRQAQARPLYEQAFTPKFGSGGTIMPQWDDRLQQLLDDPIIKQGMAKGVRIQQLESLAEGRPFTFDAYKLGGFDEEGRLVLEGVPNLRAMDAAKRGLDDILEGYRDKTTGKLVLDSYGRAVAKVRSALVSKLDDITTDETGFSAYKAAREAWSGPTMIMEAGWKGRRFLRGDVEITEKLLSAMTDAEREAFRTGARREISKLINTDTQTAVNKLANKKADLWAKLRLTFPDEQSFGLFRDDIENEAAKMVVDKFIGPRAGSQTAGLTEDIKALSNIPGGVVDATVEAARGNYFPAAQKVLGGLKNKISAPNQKTAGSISKILLEMNPQKRSAELARIGKMVKAGTVSRDDMSLIVKGLIASGVPNLTPRE